MTETPAELVARHDREFAARAAACDHRYLHTVSPGATTHQCWECTALFHPPEATRLLAVGSVIGWPPEASQ